MTDLFVRSKGERRVTVLGALTKCQVQGLWVPVHFPEGSMTRKQGLTTYDYQAHVFCQRISTLGWEDEFQRQTPVWHPYLYMSSFNEEMDFRLAVP